MKTAVSIPDEVFEKVERLAKRGRRSRSEVFTAALREYVARHSPDEVTEAINRVCADVDQTEDVKFLNAAARRLLRQDVVDRTCFQAPAGEGRAHIRRH